jgi:hypothetical protein
MKCLIMAAVFVLAAPQMIFAQEKRKKSAPSAALDVGQACRILPSAPWVKQQAEWFDESAHAWTNDTLRTALLAAAGLTLPLSAPVQLGVQVSGKSRVLGSSADAMVQQLKTLASARGSTWPTKSVVGAAGVHAVYLLAESDTGLARAALHRLMEAGPTESPAADVATLEDRLRILSGRKQLYGTQFRVDERGKVVLSPMEDSAHADLRREDAGLPPFALGLCLAKTKS